MHAEDGRRTGPCDSRALYKRAGGQVPGEHGPSTERHGPARTAPCAHRGRRRPLYEGASARRAGDSRRGPPGSEPGGRVRPREVCTSNPGPWGAECAPRDPPGPLLGTCRHLGRSRGGAGQPHGRGVRRGARRRVREGHGHRAAVGLGGVLRAVGCVPVGSGQRPPGRAQARPKSGDGSRNGTPRLDRRPHVCADPGPAVVGRAVLSPPPPKKNWRSPVRLRLNSAPAAQQILSVTGQPASVDHQPPSVDRNPAPQDVVPSGKNETRNIIYQRTALLFRGMRRTMMHQDKTLVGCSLGHKDVVCSKDSSQARPQGCMRREEAFAFSSPGR